MKILNTGQIRALDAYTIQHEPISSINLMERAAQAFVHSFCDRFVNTRPVTIFCGKGNNGGDGMAIGRMLSGRSYDVTVFIIEYTSQGTADFRENLTRLKNILTPISIFSVSEIPSLLPSSVVIDALLGSGLTRPVTGLLAEVVKAINEAPHKVVSVDIATGLYGDRPNDESDSIIEPDCTITFQLPKLAFMMPGNAKFTGEWHVVNIDLSRAFINKVETPHLYSDAGVEKLIKPRGKFAHKGTFGHALLLAGSYGKMGAAVLCAKACLRSGVGLLTLHIPECGYEIAQISVPEAMVNIDKHEKFISELPSLKAYSAVGIGPGIGKEPLTARVLNELIKTVTVPMVIDADALNLISENPFLLQNIPENTILTPHPKEFERLVGKSENEYQRLELGVAFAEKHKVIICLKGANTAVILPNGSVHFNSTGNPGMATGGTGDVLTGIITSLLAQGYAPQEAALLGVYEHGLAGDRAAQVRGQSALIASDVVDCLGW